ncbi:MAG: membrane dipeptidase, partial [Pseudomonadota bacterium]
MTPPVSPMRSISSSDRFRLTLESARAFECVAMIGAVDHIDYVVQRIGVDHVGVGTDFNHGGGIGS